MHRLFAYRKGILKPVPAIWDGSAAARAPKPTVLTFTGAGGKTTSLYALAQFLADQGRRVLILTTTHMQAPKRWGVYSGSLEDVERQLQKEGIAVAGTLGSAGKISYIGDHLYRLAGPLADVVLVEGDGSKRLPLKAMACHEPVVPPDTAQIYCLAGLCALGQAVKDGCFRCALTGLPPDAVLTEALFARIFYGQCLQVLYTRYPSVPVVPVLQQADTAERIAAARRIFAFLGISCGLITSYAAERREP